MCVLLRKDRKPRQYYYLKASTVGVMSLHAGMSYSSRMQKLSCLTARKHADETRRRGVPERRGNTSKGTVGRCVLRQEGTEAKAASLRTSCLKASDARVKHHTSLEELSISAHNA